MASAGRSANQAGAPATPSLPEALHELGGAHPGGGLEGFDLGWVHPAQAALELGEDLIEHGLGRGLGRARDLLEELLEGHLRAHHHGLHVGDLGERAVEVDGVEDRKASLPISGQRRVARPIICS